MARIVLGLGTSHSPQLSTPPEKWTYHADRDLANPHLLGSDGEFHSYQDMLTRAPAGVEKEITVEKWRARHAACQKAIDRVGDLLEAARPDAVVVIGDDQDEFFHDDNMPGISLFWGDEVVNRPRRALSPLPYMNVAAWSYETPEPSVHPVAADLSLHLIGALVDQKFDIAHSRRQPENEGIGHAWGFITRRIMRDKPIPLVPVMLNTYYPPNQPKAARCYELGQALARGIESWGPDKRVVVLASGGLSHFVILEEFDRTVIKALKDHDQHTLSTLPEKMFRTGTSEIKNWIAAAGALENLEMDLVDYVPCYRSPAGTGCAMAFAGWS